MFYFQCYSVSQLCIQSDMKIFHKFNQIKRGKQHIYLRLIELLHLTEFLCPPLSMLRMLATFIKGLKEYVRVGQHDSFVRCLYGEGNEKYMQTPVNKKAGVSAIVVVCGHFLGHSKWKVSNKISVSGFKWSVKK